jgi:hypothetical protein
VQPEKNGPALIIRFSDRTVKDVLYDGFKLTIQDVDLRYIMAEEEPNFVAYHLGCNEVILKYPSTSYTFLFDSGVEDYGLQMAKCANDRVEQATTVVCNRIAGDAQRKFKHVLFKFPEELVTDIFSSDSENGAMKSVIVPLKTSFECSDNKHNKIKLHSARANVSWEIAVAEETKRATKRVAKGKNDQADQLSRLLPGMHIS